MKLNQGKKEGAKRKTVGISGIRTKYKLIRRLALLICFSWVAGFVDAQNPIANQVAEDLLESLGENMGDDSDIQEILDDLEGFRQNPLKINLASGDDLMRLHLLSEVQVNNLIAYREKTGTVYSLFELAAVDGFTPDLLQKLEPFISFDVLEAQSGKKRASTDLLARSTRAFPSSGQAKNEGSPERYYIRMKHVSDRIEYGVVAEKDPGEAFFTQSNTQGFDYTSAFANFGLGQKKNRIFVGDYHVRFGQGLVAWQGFSMGKSAETTQVFRSGQGVKSYSSTDENQFFRGIAGRFVYRNFTFYPFLSRQKLDASIDTLEGKPYFGAFQTSGYHRTGSEIAGENTLEQIVGGGHATYSHNQWSLGLTAVYTRFDACLDRSDEPYNQFLPEGKDNLVAGFDWKGSFRKTFIFGEAAVGKNSGKALLTGVMLKPASNAELSLVYRNINKTYFSFFSNAFTESSRTNDEHALYLGLKVFPASHWILWAYADFFRHQWLKYTSAAPSSGAEFLTQVSYSPTRETQFYLRFFQEEKEQRVITENLRYNGQQLVNRLRLNFTHALNEQVSLKSRIEFSFYSKSGSENGVLVYQDVAFKPLQKPFALNGRLAWFSTDGYNSRLYAYENDLLNSFSVPALYGNGIRAYFNFQQKLGSQFTLWLKCAATHQFAKNSDETDVDPTTKSEIKLQIRYQF
jgi:hypothetical protein